jgi:hypothetical protein
MSVSLNAAQKAAVRALKGVPYGVIKASTARALIAKGVAQRVTIQPEPRDGIAVNLTLVGRSL